jgi:DNA invertase Pin-like site-specific DNA recombinase
MMAHRLDPDCVVVARIADDGPGGYAQDSSPAVAEFLREIEASTRTVDNLLVASLDRLGRTPAALALVDRLQRVHGIRVLALDGGIPGDPVAMDAPPEGDMGSPVR